MPENTMTTQPGDQGLVVSRWRVECQLDGTYIFFSLYVEALSLELAKRTWQVDALNELLPADKQIKVANVTQLP